MRTDGDTVEVVDPSPLTNPRAIADSEIPRVLDVDTWLDDHPRPDFGSEQAQPKALQANRPRQGASEEEQACGVP